ncbi:hypothetical protein HDU93_002240 [Gonapodya sp. JEL0774]|nr:hypothetical protein HDU93_002240 [Gonapodya sp. JEL0774]
MTVASNNLGILRAAGVSPNATSNLPQILSGVSEIAKQLVNEQSNSSATDSATPIDNVKSNVLDVLSDVVLAQSPGSGVSEALSAASTIFPSLMPSTFNETLLVSALTTFSKLTGATRGNGGLASLDAATNILTCIDKAWMSTENSSALSVNATKATNSTRFDVVGSNVSTSLLGAIQNLAKALGEVYNGASSQLPESLSSSDGAVVSNLNQSLTQILQGTISTGFQLHLVSMNKNPFDNSVGASLRMDFGSWDDLITINNPFQDVGNVAEQIQGNPTILAVLIAIVVVYVVLACKFWRDDAVELKKVRWDIHENKPVIFQVTINTREATNIRRTHTMSISFRGPNGEHSGELQLKTWYMGRLLLQKNQKVIFYVEAPHIKHLETVGIKLEESKLSSKGPPATWQPGEVSVRCYETSEEWSFIIKEPVQENDIGDRTAVVLSVRDKLVGICLELFPLSCPDLAAVF